jgi:hypothetical protein
MVDNPNKSGRPRKGTLGRTRDGRRQAIVTLKDGSRKRLDPFPRGMSEALMLERTAYYAQKWAGVLPEPNAGAGVPRPGGGDEWWDRYLEHRHSRGLTPVKHLYRPHIKPLLGDKHPKDWTREDGERLVTELDRKIASDSADERISWRTAHNVWSLFTKACKVACSAKAGTGLRVRADNPCAGIEAPERGEKKSKQWLYPAEMQKLLACERVPLRWRRLYALLAYTYVRPSELKVLEWSDVDLEVGTIHITKAWDRDRATVE